MRVCLLLIASLLSACATNAVSTATHSISLNHLSRYSAGGFDTGSAEIVVHDARRQRLYILNAQDNSVDVLDIAKPASPQKVATIQAGASGKANSVASFGALIAVAVEAKPAQNPGHIAFFNADTLTLIKRVPVGAGPDMITFTPNGEYLLAAIEGEPSDDYQTDPEGSVDILDLRQGIQNVKHKRAGFSHLNRQKASLQQQGIRIFGPNASVAQDLEPEYIAVSKDGRSAWVTLQENNAIAEIDIANARITKLMPLGYKDHNLEENAIDVSNKDSMINITPWPLLGMYQPDTMATLTFENQSYLVTANEGDARDYDGFSEETRAGKLRLDPQAYPNPDYYTDKAHLGRIKVTTTLGDTNQDGLYEQLYSYGARSFSIWSTDGRQTYDSGNDFERITAQRLGSNFNNNNDKNKGDSRSDDKGAEPEALAVATLFGQTYAFIGLERTGGIMVYQITNPSDAQFVDYVIDRDFSAAPESPQAGDLGPESIIIISAEDSPSGEPLLAVANEVSGTVSLYAIRLSQQ